MELTTKFSIGDSVRYFNSESGKWNTLTITETYIHAWKDKNGLPSRNILYKCSTTSKVGNIVLNEIEINNSIE